MFHDCGGSFQGIATSLLLNKSSKVFYRDVIAILNNIETV